MTYKTLAERLHVPVNAGLYHAASPAPGTQPAAGTFVFS